MGTHSGGTQSGQVAAQQSTHFTCRSFSGGQNSAYLEREGASSAQEGLNPLQDPSPLPSRFFLYILIFWSITGIIYYATGIIPTALNDEAQVWRVMFLSSAAVTTFR